MFMALLGLVGLAALLQFNEFAVWLGFSSLLIVAVYPFMKRVTSWPQAVLGLAFGWGALMGWAARLGNIEMPALLIYAGTICWIIGYDTIYAHQDREDDALIGMKSTALRFGENTQTWLKLFYGLSILFLMAGVILAGADEQSPDGLGYAFPAIGAMFAGFGVAAGLLLWQVVTLDIDDAVNCLDRFRHNHLFGAAVFAAIVIMWLIQSVSVGRTYWTPWF
jgi:4-hydroxybenzoate polyprenyltransferase